MTVSKEALAYLDEVFGAKSLDEVLTNPVLIEILRENAQEDNDFSLDAEIVAAIDQSQRVEQ